MIETIGSRFVETIKQFFLEVDSIDFYESGLGQVGGNITEVEATAWFPNKKVGHYDRAALKDAIACSNEEFFERKVILTGKFECVTCRLTISCEPTD